MALVAADEVAADKVVAAGEVAADKVVAAGEVAVEVGEVAADKVVAAGEVAEVGEVAAAPQARVESSRWSVTPGLRQTQAEPKTHKGRPHRRLRWHAASRVSSQGM